MDAGHSLVPIFGHTLKNHVNRPFSKQSHLFLWASTFSRSLCVMSTSLITYMVIIGQKEKWRKRQFEDSRLRHNFTT